MTEIINLLNIYLNLIYIISIYLSFNNKDVKETV